ncbi:MAG: HAMP domain-containing histidine kinase [Kamptonema sp. SIO4C4]|nr:HAMP domain-containing histidine kinase [Kamptonema sp. SIO4C4]
MVKETLKGLTTNQLNFYLYEMPMDQLNSAFRKNLDTPSQHLLAFYDAENNQIRHQVSHAQNTSPRCPYSSKWTACIRTLNLEDQEWSIVIVPTSEFISFPWIAGGTLGIGLLVTGFLFFYLKMSLKRTVQQEELVNALTLSESQLKKQKLQLEEALHKLKTAQSYLVQSEKMSSLGQLVAGITHELNNPLTFIQGNIDYAFQYSQDLLNLLNLYNQYYPQSVPEICQKIHDIELDYIQEDFPNLLKSMLIGTQRIQAIINSMKQFAKKDEFDMKWVQIQNGLENTLMLVQHKLHTTTKHPNIEIIKDYDDLPLVECDLGKLNQVFLCLLENAIDAINERSEKEQRNFCPKIWIYAKMQDAQHILIQIKDNGIGIPESLQPKLYDPFFTTKPVGAGTGLGLAIAYRIIKDIHRGKLWFVSQVGQGTEFCMQIPIAYDNA